MARAQVLDPQTNEVLIEFYMDERLKKNLDQKVVKQLQKKDKDCVIVIDGKEGSGKSTLAMQIGRYVDPTLNLKRVVFSPEEFRAAVLKANKGECIIYDEAFTGFSSRASLSPVNRVLISLAMQMRQKNLFIIIVLPTIFLLDKYMAIFRTKALLHVYENKGRRGFFKLYNANKKRVLILKGKKDLSYFHKKLYVRFRGQFYGVFALGGPEVEQLYRDKKEKALQASEKSSINPTQVKHMEQRNILLYLVRKTMDMPLRKFSEYLSEYGMEISHNQLSEILAKFGYYEKEEPKEKIIEKTDQKPVVIEGTTVK